MKRTPALITVFALLLALAGARVGGLRAAPASFQAYLPLLITVGPDGQSLTQHQMALQTLELINQERATAGCGPLTLNTQLNLAAQGQSQDMATRNFFTHINPDASRATPGLRATVAGYSWSMIGENIAAGYDSADSAVDGWMKSTAGHRENILNCSYTDTGIGYYYDEGDQPFTSGGPYFHYWTQVFARP